MFNTPIYWSKRFFKVIDYKRVSNFTKVKFSYYISRLTRKSWHWGFPYTISIEPTTSCNLHCPECPSGLRKFHRPTGNIDGRTIDKIIQQLGNYLIYVTFYFQGEPLLHKDFTNYIKRLKEKNIIVGTSTNAHYLNKTKALEIIDSGLDRLIISLDGTDEKSYSSYRRGGDFNLVIQNIKTMVKQRQLSKAKHPFIELQFIVFKHNEHQIKDIERLAKELGIDKLSLKTAQLYEFEEGNALMPGLVKYSRYTKTEDGKYRIKGKLPKHCNRSWSGSVISWDGNVVPCCFDKDADHTFGNIMEQEYKNIQSNNDYKKFLQQILDDRSKIEICRNCSEGL